MNRKVWTERYSTKPRKLPVYDGWLDRFEDALRNHQAGLVLDLGCGRGADSAFLTERGYRVVQTDFVLRAVSFVTRRVGTRTGVVVDHSADLPFRTGTFEVVVADLTLHYFEDAVTRRILSEIRRVLVGDGLLLSRFNSAEDHHYGADLAAGRGGATIGGVNKQFFTEERLRGLFEGIVQVTSIRPYATTCYGRPKQVIEVSARKR